MSYQRKTTRQYRINPKSAVNKRRQWKWCRDGRFRWVSKERTLNEVIEDFWSQVKRGDEKDCWEWTGCIRSNDIPYGQFRWKRKLYLSHRFSYHLHYGDLTDDWCVCHKCDNPRCVNPHHLFKGTHTDNMRDMFAKNRRLRWPSEIAKANSTKAQMNSTKRIGKI